MSRYAILNTIRQLDPVKDHQRIVHLIGAYEFPWLSRRSLEFALFRTYAVPSVSRLLHETGEFERFGQRRYDDTGLIISEIGENGYNSERGRAAIRRMNHIHSHYKISNEDYLYVLSTFIYEPIRWNDRFGWRKMIDVEKQATYHFWVQVGRRMNIKDIPTTYEAFQHYNQDYEREYFHYSEANYRVGEATIQVFLNWYPAPLRPFLRESMYALMDDPLREAFGFPMAHSSVKALVENGLKLRALFMRKFLQPRTKPYEFTKEPNRTYPDGYEIESLGPKSIPHSKVIPLRRIPEDEADGLAGD